MKNQEMSIIDYYRKDIEEALKKIDPELLDNIWEKGEKTFIKKTSRIIRSIEKKSGNLQMDKEFIVVKLKKLAHSIHHENNSCVELDEQTIKLNIFEKIILSISWTNYIKTIEPALISLHPYIVSIATKYYYLYTGLKVADVYELISEGHIGMMKAIPGYQYKKAKFITYATKWIEGEIKAFIGKNIIKYGVYIDSDSDITDPEVPDPTDQTDVLYINEELKVLLKQKISELPPKQSVAMKKLIYDEKKQKDIARQLEISESSLSQIIKRAIKKLREMFKELNLF